MKLLLFFLLISCMVGSLFSQDTSKPVQADGALKTYPMLWQMHGPIQSEVAVKIYPVLWQQTAAEYRALCYQAFNIATLRLQQLAIKRKRGENQAIITDLDETILDNSPSEAQLIKENDVHTTASWKQWTNLSLATAVPGAVAFLQMAAKKGFTIFYISNRDTAAVQSTLVNLKRLHLPNADTSHMLFLSNTSSKELRRQTVAAKYNVVMLLGDNLNDFTAAFERKFIADRFTATDSVQAEWGKRFIVLPNATYGEWENALYCYERNTTPEQREADRMKLLKGYDSLSIQHNGRQ